MQKVISLTTVIFILTLAPLRAIAQVKAIEHVVVIGVDGLSPKGIEAADTPVLSKLISQGTYTFDARGVFPTSSSPNWMSMITGATPAQHGVTSNDWERYAFEIHPAARGAEGFFPTIFGELHRQRPDAEIAVVHEWEGFGRLFEHSAARFVKHGKDGDQTIQTTIDYLKEHRPTLLFIHLDLVDHAGHNAGWFTPHYLEAVSKADNLIGRVVNAIDSAGISRTTMFLITADHGGRGRSHGGETMDELQIPWIISGAGVAKGRQILRPVNTTDTACTLAHVFGIQLDDAAVGRPVVEAFADFPETPGKVIAKHFVPAPSADPRGGLFVGEAPVVSLRSQIKDAQIRYTLDGSEPNELSPIYSSPIKLEHSATLLSKSFSNGNASRAASAEFRVVQIKPGHGVGYQLFSGEFSSFPDFSSLKPSQSGEVTEFSLAGLKPDKQAFAVQFRAILEIDKSGSYEFWTAGRDVSRLIIDGKKLLDNDGRKGVVLRSAKSQLATGSHEMVIDYLNAGNSPELQVWYQGPDNNRQIVPNEKLRLIK